eukprot:50951-Eustigmatos_ZCMA.PRE.1
MAGGADGPEPNSAAGAALSRPRIRSRPWFRRVQHRQVRTAHPTREYQVRPIIHAVVKRL